MLKDNGSILFFISSFIYFLTPLPTYKLIKIPITPILDAIIIKIFLLRFLNILFIPSFIHIEEFKPLFKNSDDFLSSLLSLILSNFIILKEIF